MVALTTGYLNGYKGNGNSMVIMAIDNVIKLFIVRIAIGSLWLL